MPVNRMIGAFQEEAAEFAGISQSQAITESAFAAFPVGFTPTALQEQIYRSAWERAQQALAQPKPRYRDVIVWN